MRTRKTFENIDPRLCNFCGACVGVCPARALSLNRRSERISFDASKCTGCGECYKNCQGRGLDFERAKSLLNCRHAKQDELIGKYGSIFIGQTRDKGLLATSSTGGVIPTILEYALEKRLVDGVILLTKSKSDPLGYKITLTKTKQDIRNRCQSVYSLVPLNSILNELKKSKLRRVAYVGLPCHVEGIRKLQLNGHPEAARIKLVLGLFCGLNQSCKALDFYLAKFGVRREDVAEFTYRRGAWPGKMYIRTKNGAEFRIGKDEYNFGYFVFSRRRCLQCFDFANEFADISFGEAWSKLPSERGWSDIIARTDAGEQLLLALARDGKITLEESGADKLINTHRGYLQFKKEGISYRIKKMGLGPDYGPALRGQEARIRDKLAFAVITLLRSPLIRSVLYALPLKLVSKTILLLRKLAVRKRRCSTSSSRIDTTE